MRNPSYQRFTQGPSYRYRDTTFYAMNGYICLHYEESGEFRVLTCSEWFQRTQALNLEAKRLAELMTEYPSKKSLAELRDQIQHGVNAMGACYFDATEQGDHEDPEVSAWFRRHRPWSRGRIRPPSHHADFRSPQIPVIDPGRDTGRRATPTKVIPQAVAAAGSTATLIKPKRKLRLPANLF